MGKLNPAIMNKAKWKEKTTGAFRTDIDRNEGLIIGYAIAFFDPFNPDPELQFSFTTRLAHSPKYMNADQRERLETSLRYIMAGVEKIMNVDREEIERWASGKDEDDLNNYIKRAKLQ